MFSGTENALNDDELGSKVSEADLIYQLGVSWQITQWPLALASLLLEA